MNDQRSLIVAVSCPAAVVAGSFAFWLVAVAPAAIENSSANVAAELPAPPLAAHTELADVPSATTMSEPVAVIDVPTIALPAVSTTTDTAPAATVSEPVVKLASADPVQMLPAETPPQLASSSTPEPVTTTDTHEPAVKLASADPTDMLPAETPPLAAASATTPGPAETDAKATTREGPDLLEAADECLVVDVCIDRYLWALYQRTPKEDSIKVQDRRSVTIKRRGKMVTVMRSFTKLVDEDFAWKDPKAADKAGMSLMDYVIGGMDRNFKLKLFHTLHAAQAAGLEPGITSAFRDDYRQSIASGLKAASNRSYHGGSTRGGYGHGLAADIVSVKGENRAQRWVSTELLWKWVDANGKALGIGRPYLDHDPPHVGPVDGQEYVSRRGGTPSKQAAADARPHKKLAARKLAAARRSAKHTATRETRSPAKQPQAARASKVRTS
ncbi:hypothetical protein NLM33_04685 [Bradyrhizobium sp. CCGUVB1N3]|uniref:hypothetical protein n=1 Tax=Bradyrhizobium sp. CCGUVB1N3 TaxID=2949629 RepID=UPI0020B2379E|nr:hypothetical protein [Bradyrhizobium sp. CCGUVB1N3]MCP3469625.1 hypothetical protein [Bradyrhizobium sp. CCGUVB1N3]